jgi:chromosomal replication initiation ATPase DnaA
MGGALQLPLALAHAPQYGRDSFVEAASNEAALRLVERWPHWPAPVVVLSGPQGSGKSHLAHIWAERAGARIVAATALAAEASSALTTGRPLAVEDVVPEGVPEHALFHLINSAKEAASGLLITSRLPAGDWRVALPDLRSRLRMAAPAALLGPDDDLLRKVLVKLFADRQLFVDKPLIDYLVVRMERSLGTAAAIVAAIDRDALASGRRPTRAMAAHILSRTAPSGGFTRTE